MPGLLKIAAEVLVADPRASLADVAAAAALRRLVDVLLPLGPRVEFLLRQPELDADAALAARIEWLDEPVEEFFRRGGPSAPCTPSRTRRGRASPAGGSPRSTSPELAFRTVLAGIGDAP